MPFIDWAGRYHIGMAGEYQQGAGGASARVEVVDIAKTHALDLETQRFQARDHHVLAARVIGGIGAAGDQCLG